MISVDQLVVSFGGFDLFKGVSFLVAPKDRIGLTGKNGAGKSTLLKILAGKQLPSEGTVSSPKDTRVGYLPQHMVVDNTKTVFDETKTAFDEILSLKAEIDHLNHEIATREDYESDSYMQLINRVTDLNDRYLMVGGTNMEGEIEQTLKGLGFERKDFTRQTSEFSGGWRMRIELAKILLRKPDVFLLDEPTNHLDIESIQWLEDFLANYNGAVVLVSHDRAFLDNVTNRTIEISLGKIYDYKANYTRYLELRKEHRETQLAAYRNQQKLIEETEQFIERFRYKATKAVQVQSRTKMLEKLDRIEVDDEDNSRLNIKFPPAIRSGTIVAECKHLSKSYGDLEVLNDIDLIIERGEKVAFVGKNGEGKTTLARVILGELEHTGELKIGHNVKVGYFAQNQAQKLDENLTVLETIDQIAVGDIRTRIRDILGAFMFSGEDVDKKVKVLSGGERMRLAMIKLMLEPVNFLVLDEPTNHLDIRSKEMLKNALADYDGTVLVVSHDREFLDGLVNCVYEFKHKKVKQHLGGIYDFLQKKKLESLKELEQKTKPGANNAAKTVVAAPAADDNKLSYEERKEINKQISRLEKSVEQSENDIARIEDEIATMDQQMANPEMLNDASIFEKYDQLKQELEKVMEQWTEYTEEYEGLLKQKTW
ncbi:ABC-F family ATP-binding cassette domain-containing protein [Mangrovibacterium marinum]|uniref:Probable ATP-binding protein YbiT n=1 Tax=Mangrovibacterium marinum TaxID=1639118 RepID=A0A2T5C0H2_9BACT|nr:ABC-F family ATP-binding cassette domain-containing protein [Mangrovibacterium marinum]PTN08115.1 ATP-binding cassette subfamily F protein 3 [Mangrovibacterium marinum]